MAAEASSIARQEPAADTDAVSVERISCCVVGGGPAGAVLALMLARKGVPVMLLEQHHDFDRDFRGDTIHPSVMEIMDELGLAHRLLQLPHSEMRQMSVQTAEGPVPLVDLARLKTRFPFIMMVPQVEFLDFIVAEAKRYPSFRLVLGARVEHLILDGDVVRGVRYRAADGFHDVRAPLTVGADGRFSTMRRLSGLQPISTSPPMDVLWFRLPRRPEDPADFAGGRIGSGHILAILGRPNDWQLGYVIPKGSYQKLRASGIDELRRAIAGLAPEFGDRVDTLQDWHQVSLLSVESDRLPRWYRPGLLLIGDAAHTMSPVGGVGINYAIQDAVAAANVLTAPLLARRLRLHDLAAVQRQREWPVRIIQALQTFLQRQVLAGLLASNATASLPPVARLFLRTPILRDLPARLVAFGVRPAHVQD